MKLKIVKIFVLMLLTISTVTISQPQFSEYNSMAGSFSRMGFGARGMGMGNAMTAVVSGNLVSYYNPALSAFQNDNYFQTSYSFLSLDRSLNFLNFTKKFEFGKTKKKKTAGISLGIINAGVSGIDGRDNQGLKTKDLSTSENQFFISFANRFTQKISIGVGVKFYYYKLYEQISATAFGLDLGIVYLASKNLTIAGTLTDINSKYKWDTSPIYDIEGNSTTYNFPLLMKLGASYRFDNPNLIASIEFEHSNAETNFIRVGTEYNIYENLFLRGGIDRISFGNSDIPIRPSLGFSYLKKISNINVGINYAFVAEPYSVHASHIIGLEILF